MPAPEDSGKLTAFGVLFPVITALLGIAAGLGIAAHVLLNKKKNESQQPEERNDG